MLHTLSRSASQFDYPACLNLLKKDDVVILMQDAVTIAMINTSVFSALVDKTTHIYVLNVDINARGLCDYISPTVTVIDYNQLVDLTVQHFPQLAW